MIKAEFCPGCGGRNWRGWPALVSGFIKAYALTEAPEECHLLECSDCGLRFFDLRYTDAETHRLYEDYRGPRYLEARRRHEPRYTARANDSAAGDPEIRRTELGMFLSRYLVTPVTAPVVDYGGDQGQFIPELFTGERYVFDISDKPPIQGTNRIAIASDLAKLRPPYVLLSHVLEHLTQPIDILKAIREIMSTDGKLYVEVPNERHWLGLVGCGEIYRSWLRFIDRHGLTSELSEIYTGLFLRFAHTIPPLAPVKLHEHINFFDETSLRALLSRAGFRSLAFEANRSVFRLLAELG